MIITMATLPIDQSKLKMPSITMEDTYSEVTINDKFYDAGP